MPLGKKSQKRADRQKETAADDKSHAQQCG